MLRRDPLRFHLSHAHTDGMSLLKDICDALAAGLAAKTFTSVTTQPIVERVNWPQYSVEEMDSPRIAVTPGGDTLERTDRTRFQHDYSVNVFIGRHTPAEADADDMLSLAEEVVDAITAHAWGEEIEFPATSPMTVQIEINPDDAVNDRNVWRAVVSATYRTFR